MKLKDATEKTSYIISAVDADGQNGEVTSFLSSLGCYQNMDIVVLKKTTSNFIVGINGVRYGIDTDIVELIEIA